MRFAVVGFYGHCNAGDDRMLHCVRRLLAEHEVWPINGFAGIRQHWDEINRCDYVLFGGGGVIQRGTGVHAPLFAELRPKLACVGISVEAVHRDNIELVDVLKEKSEWILVRDAESRQRFGSHPKVTVGPDLTFLYPYDVAAAPKENACGINLLAWPYWKSEYKSRFDKLMRRLDRRFAFIKKAYPLPKWEPEKALAVLNESFSSLVPIPLYCETGRPNDVSVLSGLFGEVPSEFSPARMAECRTIVSMRLHALIFACQMGIPFISLSYQPKNVGFCKSVGMRQYSVDLFRKRELPRAIRVLRESHEELRERLLTMRAKNQRKITSLMKDLLGHSVVCCN